MAPAFFPWGDYCRDNCAIEVERPAVAGNMFEKDEDV